MENNNLITLLLITLPFYFLISLALANLFKKAGEEYWKGFVPVQNIMIWLDLIGKPKWYIALIFIPVVNVFILLSMMVDIVKCFGRDTFWDTFLVTLFGFIYLPVISFRSDVRYQGTLESLPKPERSSSREWMDAISFAVVAATLIRWLIMEAFVIPTPSMENSLLMGDFLFVSKFHYGARTPKTPLQIPLTHQTIWGTNIPSYTELIQLPQYRLPGLTKVYRNDVVVFNYPKDGFPTDLKTNYIKRCVAIAGDTIKVSKRQVYVNGQAVENPKRMQFMYKVYVNGRISHADLAKYSIPDFQNINVDATKQIETLPNGKKIYRISLTEDLAEKLKADGVIESYELIDTWDPYFAHRPTFPEHPLIYSMWALDDYGPLWVPKKGATIQLDSVNVSRYYSTIADYEGWEMEEMELKENTIYLHNQPLKEYTFKQNYYFMMGDNRHESADSRFWGFVPEDHIVGKALFIWMSKDDNYGWIEFWNKIRWERLFKVIH